MLTLRLAKLVDLTSNDSIIILYGVLDNDCCVTVMME